jgi:hypothetical protein
VCLSEEKDSVARALEARKAQYELDRQNQIEFEVKDSRHARSKEVLDYCVRELAAGTTWRALRFKLGLGDYAHDERWKIIRSRLTNSILPKNEQEAVKANYSILEYYLEKIDDLVMLLDDRIKNSEGLEIESRLIEAQIKAITIAMERQERKLESYFRMRKLQLDEKHTQGPSIIFQNNFHIPRPGEVVSGAHQNLSGQARQLLSQVLDMKVVKKVDDE